MLHVWLYRLNRPRATALANTIVNRCPTRAEIRMAYRDSGWRGVAGYAGELLCPQRYGY